MCNVISISSLSEYIDFVIKSFPKINRKFPNNEKVFFRGQSKSFPLLPSIARKINSQCNSTFMDHEKDMVITAKLQNPRELANEIFPINMLAKMQHYGLPTRLLDLTENALVALYFACNKDFVHDGEVIFFKIKKDEVHSAYSVYANLAAFLSSNSFTTISIIEYINTAKHENFIPRAERQKPSDTIADIVASVLDKPLFVLPEMLSEREKRQQSAVIVFPNDLLETHDGSLFSPSTFKKIISEISKETSPYITQRISVVNKRKRKILNELELVGISEQFLFPEIEKKCIAIKNQVKNLIDE